MKHQIKTKYSVQESTENFPISYGDGVEEYINANSVEIWSDGTFSDSKEKVLFVDNGQSYALIHISSSMWQGIGENHSIISFRRFSEFMFRYFPVMGRNELEHINRLSDSLELALSLADECQPD